MTVTTRTTDSGANSNPAGGILGVQIVEALPIAYRSSTSGNWNSTSTWQVSNDGGSTWGTASATPTSDDRTILIQNGHTVTVTAPVTVDEVTVDAGGQITINSGQTLTVADGSGVDLTVAGTVNGAGTLSMAGQGSLSSPNGAVTVDMLTGAGSLTSASAQTLTIGGGSASSTFNGELTGSLNLTKTGTGTLILAGVASTYSGTTVVSGGGALLVTGSTGSGSAVTVANTSTLGGTGTINGPVSVSAGGMIQPTLSGGAGRSPWPTRPGRVSPPQHAQSARAGQFDGG